MRVATFNIHHGTVGERGHVDAYRLAEVCAGFDADVIALQEVEHGTPRTWRVDLVGAIARACSMTALVRPSRRYPLGWQGNALLVRGEIESSSVMTLPRIPTWSLLQERRIALEAVVRVGDQRRTVTTTHLAVEPAVGQQQLAAVLAGGSDRIVLGDLNLPPDAVRAAAQDAGFDYVEHGPTYPAEQPHEVIDHVLVPPGTPVRAVEVRVTPMSDHAALLVDLG